MAVARYAPPSFFLPFYHAFLSFRGQDTRKGFTDHLYRALVQAGICTFRDNDGIRRGENIESELEKAIQESQVSIIVFSKDYASSRWCLNELLKIVERRNTDPRHVVLPVFYDVDPYDVRNQSGTFAEAFARHEERFSRKEVELWKRALRDVASLAGMVLGDGFEWHFIQAIVEEVKDNLAALGVALFPVFPVGMDNAARVPNTMPHALAYASNDVSVAVVHGTGGIARAQGRNSLAETALSEQPNDGGQESLESLLESFREMMDCSGYDDDFLNYIFFLSLSEK